MGQANRKRKGRSRPADAGGRSTRAPAPTPPGGGQSERPRLGLRQLSGFFDKQWLAFQTALTYRYVFYGGSRGPGKSYWLRWFLILFCILAWRRFGLVGVTVGLFCEDYPTLRDRQITKLALLPRWLGQVHESKDHGLVFQLNARYGGGRVALRNLDDPSKYQSAEFAAIGVEELTRNPKAVFDSLRGSLRWPGLEHTPFVAAGNPGGIGHAWVKALWIDRVFPPELAAEADEFRYIRALPSDNPHLPAGYWHMLLTLAPDLRRAWLEGDWDVFEGMAFSAFRRHLHVVRPVELPRHWPRWRSVDWGSAAPFSCLWLAQDPDIGRVVAYRQVYQAGLTDRQQAALILANSPEHEQVNITYADPSMWTKKAFENTVFSSADEYRKAGVPLTPAVNDRIGGKRKVDTLLANLPDGRPGLLIFDTCSDLVRTLPALPYSKIHPEDVDSDAEDHAYDSLRYGLTRVKPRTPAAPPDTLAALALLAAKDPLAARAVALAGGGLKSKDL